MLKKPTTYISEYLKELLQILKNTSFSRAVLVGIAVSLPIILGIRFDQYEIGLALCFGAFWSSPSDISGSFRHKKIGILTSAALAMVVGFIGGYLHYETWLALSVIGFLGFGIAYLSIYGFRASLVSFSGLLALVLSFAHDAEEIAIYQFALFIGLGGVWYLLLAKIWYHIHPTEETEELFSETYVLTAEFLETRRKLVDPYNDREDLMSKNMKLQSELTTKHESLRRILISKRSTRGHSDYQDRRLLVFVQLVEMMETAIANPVNYDRMDVLFSANLRYLQLIQDLIYEMARQLRRISEAGNDTRKLPASDALEKCFEATRIELSSRYRTLRSEEYLMLENLLGYQEKQFKKLKRIKQLLDEKGTIDINIIDRKAAKRFVVSQELDPDLVLRNFSFKSTIFRHSLRLAVTIMIGYTLGSLFPFQNPYWILLTIIVIMRPSYGLTKSRAKDRMVGTLIGGLVAIGMVFFIQNPYAYGVLAIVFLVFAIALAQRNARSAAIFITLNVVFIFALLSPDIMTVIKFRIVDTLVGAGLSYAAMRWLWPTWESTEIKASIEKSLRANKEFLHEIGEYYQKKGDLPIGYRLARREAFLQTSDLNSAFQRMAQEPKSKQYAMERHYELVVLNHTFLASLASLSTFIQSHETTEASEQFEHAIGKIRQNLDMTLQCTKDASCEVAKTYTDNAAFFEDQLPDFSATGSEHFTAKSERMIRILQEAHLVWEQLQWLYSISARMLKVTVS